MRLGYRHQQDFADRSRRCLSLHAGRCRQGRRGCADAERLPQRQLPEKLYDNKTQYYRDKGLSEAAAREKAAAIVNPPGCSEHNCGLAADLNSPEHTTLDTGFADTAAFRWLCENAEQYGFILRYPKEAESVTGITYEPWHWRYVGPENAALLNRSGLCLEDAVAVLQRIAAGETVTG